MALVDTFGKATLQELDYVLEAQNQTRCKAELESRLAGKVYVPEVFSEISSRWGRSRNRSRNMRSLPLQTSTGDRVDRWSAAG